MTMLDAPSDRDYADWLCPLPDWCDEEPEQPTGRPCSMCGADPCESPTACRMNAEREAKETDEEEQWPPF